MKDAISTVGDVVRHYAQSKPDHPAIIFGSRTTTYVQLNRFSNQLARGLSAPDNCKDNRVAYLGKNTDYYYELFFGCAKAARVLVAINWRLASPEVEYILSDAQVEILFVESEFADQVNFCLQHCDRLKRVIYIDRDDETGYRVWRDAQVDTDLHVPVQPEDTCIQMYTSGTTGRPKGVLLPHRCFFAQRQAEVHAGTWAQWSGDEVNLVAMPIFHIGGTGWGFIAFYHGASNVIHPSPDAESIAKDIAEYRINRMFIVPAVLQQIVDYSVAQTIDVSSVESVVYGASPIQESLLQSSIALFGCDFVQQYGMTEATGAVSYLPAEDHDIHGNKRMKSCGIPFPGIVFRICDSAGNPLESGQVGEIHIKSPAIMAGYWNLPEATGEVLREGWYRTGDAGYLDADGYLFVQDRIKDMIVSGGENIYPAEIEAALHSCGAIREAAVIGVPDAKWGESVKALVVPEEGDSFDADAVIQVLRQQIAGYKVPKSIDVIDAIPRNASGKVLKHVLREPYWKGYSKRVN